MTDTLDDQLPHRQNHEDLIRLILNEGRTVLAHPDSTVEVDVDGMPVGVTPAEPHQATLGRIRLSAGQWEQLARHLIHKHEAQGRNQP